MSRRPFQLKRFKAVKKKNLCWRTPGASHLKLRVLVLGFRVRRLGNPKTLGPAQVFQHVEGYYYI